MRCLRRRRVFVGTDERWPFHLHGLLPGRSALLTPSLPATLWVWGRGMAEGGRKGTTEDSQLVSLHCHGW